MVPFQYFSANVESQLKSIVTQFKKPLCSERNNTIYNYLPKHKGALQGGDVLTPSVPPQQIGVIKSSTMSSHKLLMPSTACFKFNKENIIQ